MNFDNTKILKSSLTFTCAKVAVAMILLAGCASMVQPLRTTKTVELAQTCDISRDGILSWRDYKASSQRQLPYSVRYEGCGKTLYYIAANHTNEPDSKTYQAIETVFKRDDVDMVIVEGFPSQSGISPTKMLTYAKSVKNNHADSEPYFSIRQATASGADFMGGEPTDSDILRAVADKGISPVDLLGFYIVRQIPQLIRSKSLSDHRDPRLENEIFNIVGSFAQSTQMPIEVFNQIDGLEPFLKWYQTTNGLDFYESFRVEDAWPASAVAEPRETNRLSDLVADARDQHIIGIIQDAVASHKTVMVVYGGSHHTVHAPALDAAFPKAEILKLSPNP